MKRSILGILALTAAIAPLALSVDVSAQSGGELYYTFKGRRIPLQQRQDVIAVAFKNAPVTRSGGNTAPVLRLEQDLQGGLRSAVRVEVTPLGESYALVNIPSGAGGASIKKRIEQQAYVQSTIPVLTRNNTKDLIGLPNEIIITFKPGLSEDEKQAILKKNSLAPIRKLRFSPNHYLVKSTTATGTQVLSVANQLTQMQGVTSATPNFIQSVSTLPKSGLFRPNNQNKQNKQNKEVYPNPDYIGLQWHLNSVPLKECLDKKATDFDALQSCLKTQSKASQSNVTRSDMRVTEAWKVAPNKGRDVVVAVIDSAIQWNHPDLKDSLYTVTAPDKCPGEIHGWDFSDKVNTEVTNPCDIGDPDTRLNNVELTLLNRRFRDTFLLTDTKFLQRYPRIAEYVKSAGVSEKEALKEVRNLMRAEIGSEFHGTWVSGVIAAKPSSNQGVIGVAPNAKILPIRVFGLNGSFSVTGYIEAIGYAASRGADVINLSLGTFIPSDAEAIAYEQILSANPNLVVVASSGNSNNYEVAYPSGYEGVISVGATNIAGKRAPYSNFGKGLGLVAPGGDTVSPPGMAGGIVTTGGTWLEAFWQGVPAPTERWGDVVDMRGRYWSVQGTSFSSPAVAGVVALIKGEDTNKQLTRQQITDILKSTSGYNGLTLTKNETDLHSMLTKEGQVPSSVKDKQYFFGSGIVNAEAAINAAKKSTASR
jgi:serine protease